MLLAHINQKRAGSKNKNKKTQTNLEIWILSCYMVLPLYKMANALRWWWREQYLWLQYNQVYKILS